jgi:glycosyltransferase involved in cell wall biosynthesis
VYDGKSVAVVVPAYREEALIGRVITTMPSFVDRIIVVNDASPDGTSGAARATGDRRLDLIEHEVNTGVGGAVVTGHRRALETGTDIICIMAGDAQCDPDYLEDLVRPVAAGITDMAKANRFFSSDSFEGMPKYRVLGNVTLSMLNKFASGYWHLFDPQNGYLAISREALEAVNLDRISKGYSLENSMLIELNILGARVVDVPVPAIYGDEVSSIKLSRVAPAIAGLMVKGFWSRVTRKYLIWSFSPIALFLLAGLALLLLGAAISIWVVVETVGSRTASAGSVLLAVVPLLLGVQLLVQGLALDVEESRALTPEIDRFGGHATRRRTQRRRQASDGGMEGDDHPDGSGRGFQT